MKRKVNKNNGWDIAVLLSAWVSSWGSNHCKIQMFMYGSLYVVQYIQLTTTKVIVV